LRFISFYKFGVGKHYYEKDKRSDFNLISRSYYNYASSIIGYGITNKITLETEMGYFLNKSQEYNTTPVYTLTGKGFSNIITLIKYNLYTNHDDRRYYSAGFGVKIPCSRAYQSVNNIELPVDVQPTIGAYGVVLNSIFVKENSGKGRRFFITNRLETNLPNKKKYLLGAAVFNSVYISKHLMAPWVKGDWTLIFQFRNEIRARDKIEGAIKESSGSIIFLIVPQINYVLKEKWYFSAMVDVPVYQYFIGTQLGATLGVTASISKNFSL
ncbi:MAG: hypothetical protein JXB17_01900, partial [Bacteroidales bacterium]|nr:hypothetical protein [Bacteroidales bacterium]